MIICAKCNCVSKPGEGTHLVVRETRDKIYETVIGDYRKISNGWEIVRESRICDGCNTVLSTIAEPVKV